VRIPSNAWPTVLVRIESEADATLLATAEGYIRQLARVQEVQVGTTLERPQLSAVAVTDGLEVYVPLEGVIDVAAETQRVERELERVQRELERVDRKLRNRDFLARAPAEVVAKERESHRMLREAGEKLSRHLGMLRYER
jgi:valyl-tRNA synthetase